MSGPGPPGAMANVPSPRVRACPAPRSSTCGRHDAAFRGLGRKSCRRGAGAHRTCRHLRVKGWKHTRLVSANHVPARLRRRRAGWRAGANHDVFKRGPMAWSAAWASELIHERPILVRSAPPGTVEPPDSVRPHACRTSGGRRADGLSAQSRPRDDLRGHRLAQLGSGSRWASRPNPVITSSAINST